MHSLCPELRTIFLFLWVPSNIDIIPVTMVTSPRLPLVTSHIAHSGSHSADTGQLVIARRKIRRNLFLFFPIIVSVVTNM